MIQLTNITYVCMYNMYKGQAIQYAAQANSHKDNAINLINIK